jgi:MinD-like ATPase involved in chromosome partitioning or flagellar assembly
MTASTLLKSLEKIGNVKTVFSFPYIKVVVSSERFRGLLDAEREAVLASDLQMSIDEVRRTATQSLMLIRPVAPGEEASVGAARSTHWLAALTNSAAPSLQPQINAVHFYGYKGGQARSTILAELALSLAQDGWRVLAVDADVEAPSLNTLFAASSTTLGSTLLGVSQNGGTPPQPLTVFTTPTGSVGLFNCWPTGGGYSIDAAAFALRSALEPTVLQGVLTKLRDYALANRYDVILVDHRTGISPSILPTIASLPGRVVIAIRLDEQWQPARQFLRLVMNSSTPKPSVFAVWKPDAEDARSFSQRTFRQREDLLEMLADSLETDDLDEDSIVSSSEISDHFVTWPYDSSFRSQRLPEPKTLDLQNQEALGRIRSLLNLGELPRTSVARTTNISGAKDQGDLIVTRALRELLAPANPYSYILGRKGTGKTRLARELAARSLGELLLVPDDSREETGLRSGTPELRDAIRSCGVNPDHFWLSMFTAGIKVQPTRTAGLTRAFSDEVARNRTSVEMISSWHSQGQSARLFLLDSLETAFPSSVMPAFLDSLFRVLSMIEADSRIADRVKFRIFLRRDLAQPGFVQNIEQQLYGKSLELSWDYQSILNFMLSRIVQNAWYRETFPQLCSEIEQRTAEVLAGEVRTLECENLLLMAFPSTVKRNNLSTTTFLRTYFSDSASDRGPGDSSNTDDIRRYYPRVFDDFLTSIPGDLRAQDGAEVPLLDEDGRIGQQRIFRAHEKAANNYLLGLKQELAYLVSLSADPGENQSYIDRILAAFEGLQTPFKIESRVAELSNLTNLPTEQIRSALERMKDVGMFEPRPDYPGEWRVGRLFKSSLRMRYVRGRVSRPD